jgi:hypothetical protein
MAYSGPVPHRRSGGALNAPASAPPIRMQDLASGQTPKKEMRKDKVRMYERAMLPSSEAEYKVSERDMRDEGRADSQVAASSSKLSADLLPLLEMKDRVKDYSKGKVVVKDGKITLQVWLTKASDEVLKKLKDLGMEISFNAATGKMVIGTIDVEKLKDLAQIPEVRLIEPFTTAG